MIILPPDIDEIEAYHLTPLEHRWIYNKLTLAERLGHLCGPGGTEPPVLGWYCYRPIMNLGGLGWGGFIKFHVDFVGPNETDLIPGWFWCQWFGGDHQWIDFTDDQPVYTLTGVENGDYLEFNEDTPPQVTLPPFLQGFSKHLLVECIGGRIIEVAPRHQNRDVHDAQGRINRRYRKVADQRGRPDARIITHMNGHYWESV